MIALQHERKAPRPIYKEAQVYYNDFSAEKRSKKFTQKTHDFNFICKATNPNIPITRKEQDLLADISNIIKASSRGLAYLSHTELSNLTGNNKRQNNIMRKNLSHILRSKWKKKVKIEGAVMSKVIIFRYTTNGEVILNNPREYYEKVKTGTRVPVSIYKDENIKEYRSNAQAHGSNFYNNFDSSIQLVEEQKEWLAEEGMIVSNAPTEETKVKNRRANKRKANQRKKPTNSSMKAKIIKLVSYSKPKSLGEMHSLLDQGMCDELRSKSGREFSNNFIAQKVLAMSKNPAITASFRYKAGFISYMSLALRHELHDTVKTSGEGFRLRSNMTEEDKQDDAAEKFLTDIEQEAIRRVCPENQLKAKLANALEKTKAYQLLSSFIKFKVSDRTVQIHLNRILSITEHEKSLILSQVQATYERADFSGAYQFIENLEFVVEKPAYDWHIAKANNANTNCWKEPEPLKLPEGVWGEVLEKLIAEYGVDTYKHWFSKLTAKVDEVAKTIELKASSSMVEDRIISNYARSITQIASGIGFELKGVI